MGAKTIFDFTGRCVGMSGESESLRLCWSNKSTIFAESLKMGIVFSSAFTPPEIQHELLTSENIESLLPKEMVVSMLTLLARGFHSFATFRFFLSAGSRSSRPVPVRSTTCGVACLLVAGAAFNIAAELPNPRPEKMENLTRRRYCPRLA
jgi:hypothetical protein